MTKLHHSEGWRVWGCSVCRSVCQMFYLVRKPGRRIRNCAVIPLLIRHNGKHFLLKNNTSAITRSVFGLEVLEVQLETGTCAAFPPPNTPDYHLLHISVLWIRPCVHSVSLCSSAVWNGWIPGWSVQLHIWSPCHTLRASKLRLRLLPSPQKKKKAAAWLAATSWGAYHLSCCMHSL